MGLPVRQGAVAREEAAKQVALSTRRPVAELMFVLIVAACSGGGGNNPR